MNFVKGNERKHIARPQPRMKDRRTKRQRSRSDARRAALREQA